MKKFVIVAGAGISIAPPANLLSWWQYNKKLIEIMKEQALQLCPTASEFIELIDVENTLPVQCISDVIVRQGAGESYFPLLELLNSTSPNANHFALAELAKKGVLKAVVTTNFDTLIETAFRREAVPLMTIVEDEIYYESAKVSACKLFKIHGTVDEYSSLIDTVTQKAVGLSPAKRLILEKVFSDSEIIFIGFSGADFDFDLDYIPIAQAVENGSMVTWIVHPGSDLNHNIEELAEKYPANFRVFEKDLLTLFRSYGVDYQTIDENLRKSAVKHEMVPIDKRIREMFASPHIGEHGCVGYCITLLDMMGLTDAATGLAEIYEKKILSDGANIWGMGLNELALKKMQEGEYEESIRYSSILIKCICDRKKTIEKEMEKGITFPEEEELEKCNQELFANLSGAFVNIGVAYLYEEDFDNAEIYLNNARRVAERYNNVNTLGISLFNLARVQYKKEGDYDKYITALQKSAEYAKKAGNLRILAEILEKESSIMLEIGEYDLAWDRLEKCEGYIKNVGNFATHIEVLLLKAKYFRRRNKLTESQEYFKKAADMIIEKENQRFAGYLIKNAVEMYDYDNVICELIDLLCNVCEMESGSIKAYLKSNHFRVEMENTVLPAFIAESIPDDKCRRAIIYYEYLQKREPLSRLFIGLCISYNKRGDYYRLYDVSKCACHAACNEKDRSVALYHMGCASLENNNFTEAVNCFKEIICLRDEASQTHLGWAYIELANIDIQKGDIDSSKKYYNIGKNILQSAGNEEEMVNACMNYGLKLFHYSYFDKALDCFQNLLNEVRDSGLRKEIESTITALKNDAEKELRFDINIAGPQELGDRALRIYDSGEDTAYAWQLIQLAKERYEENGDTEGVGRCENNMACFCMKEEKFSDALSHYEKALAIKSESGDVAGVINQLSAIINLNFFTSVDLNKYVNYALSHLPDYECFTEKYGLYYALAGYYFQELNYAEALSFAKLAQEGIMFVRGTDKNNEAFMTEIIALIEGFFGEKDAGKTIEDKFSEELGEAVRLYKAGEFSDCCMVLDKLEKEFGEDWLKQGQIYGTRGNACLNEGKYQEALVYFSEAMKFFRNTKPNDQERAEQYIAIAENGMTLALSYLERTEEAIGVLREKLANDNLSQKNRFIFTINLCNRLICFYNGDLQKESSIFEEICNMLDELQKNSELSHEEYGILYSAYGLLYRSISDDIKAEKYYRCAKKELLITNSLHLEEVDMALENIEKCKEGEI